MTKYFAQDTPQASLERMMMSVPGFQRRGGGISFSSFHYKPEDVDCQYCLHYRRKSCQIPICPYIAERLASGALEYHDLLLECLGRNLRLRLYQRIIRDALGWPGSGHPVQDPSVLPKGGEPATGRYSFCLLGSPLPFGLKGIALEDGSSGTCQRIY